MKEKRIITIILVSIIFIISLFVFIKTDIPHNLFKLKADVTSVPTGSPITDVNLYKCVIDSYNKEKKTSYDYTHIFTDDELSQLTVLSCPHKEVNDATGIEKMTSLKELNLLDNNIKQLNLMNNKDLIKLYLGNSSRGNNLENLDLTNNTELKILDISHCHLSQIDLTNNIKLEELVVINDYSGDVKLTGIDLSNNTNIKKINLTSNRINEIDLSNNVELTSLILDGNGLNDINLNTNIYLNALSLSYNNFENIDLSNNTLLKDIRLNYCNISNINLENNTNLVSLSMEFNKLTSIDLKNQGDKIKSINLSFNNINEIDLSFNSKITYLNLSYNKLNSIDLKNNQLIESLDLKNNELTSLDLTNNKKITTLIIDPGVEVINSQIGTEKFNDVRLYSCVIDEFNRLNKENYDISNDLSDEQLKMITELSCENANVVDTKGIEKLTNLIYLNLRYNRISEINLSNNTKLEELFLNNDYASFDKNYIERNHIEKIDLSNNVNLIELNLYGNNIALLDLSNNINLKKVNIGENQFTSIDLSNNNKIEELNLDSLFAHNGYLSDEVFIKKDHVFTAIKLNNSLEYQYNIDHIIDETIIENNHKSIVGRKGGSTIVKSSLKVNGSAKSNYNQKYNVVELSSNKYIVDNKNDVILLPDESDTEELDKNLSVNFGSINITGNKVNVVINNEVFWTFNILKISDLLTIKDGVVVLSKNSTKKTITDLLGTEENIKVFDKYNNEIDNTTKICTGDTLKINNTSYQIAIKGDINKDSILTGSDVSQAYSAYTKAIQLSKAQFIAADYNGDGILTGSDVSAVYSLYKN